ncbi:hypothetical protein [Nocardioides sp. KR10-350]
MTVTIRSESEYLVSAQQPTTEAEAQGQDFYVDPNPRISVSGENVRLTHS